MITIWRYSFWKARGQILGWGISLALLGAYLVQFFDTLTEQQEGIRRLLESYPPELMAFFGGVADLFSPGGYLHSYFFSYMPLILGIYSVLAGSGLLAGDEESGKLDLVLAHPVSRSALFFGRLLAFAVALMAILLITWLGFVATMPATSLEISLGEMALPFISLFAVLMLFGTLALLLSMLLPSRSMAAMVAGLFLVADYFITSLANIDENLERISQYTPLNFHQGGFAIQGLNLAWFTGLLAVTALLALLAWQLFERRDIRVGGEAGWHLFDYMAGRRKKAGLPTIDG